MENNKKNHAPPKYIELQFDEAAKSNSHLDLLVVTATNLETKALHREMKPLPDYPSLIKAHHKNQTYYLGCFGVYGVIHVQCDMGAIGRSASIATVTEAIDVWKPKAVLMCGIAFGIAPQKQRIGDVLVSDGVIPYNIKKVRKNQTIHCATIPRSGVLLFNRFKSAIDWEHQLPDGNIAELIPGYILSGESLIDNREYRNSLMKCFPHAIGGEMEGVGIYAGAENKGLQWIVVKGICDFADGNKSKNKSEYQKIAIESSLSLCIKVFSSRTGFKELGLRPIEKVNLNQEKEQGYEKLTLNSNVKVRDEKSPIQNTGILEEIKERLVLIEPGEFTMGDKQSGHVKVKISHPFWIDKYPMTQALYEKVMGTNPSEFKGSDRPVENISWFQAVEFCNELSRQAGLDLVYTIKDKQVKIDYDKIGFRLPNEAEWEYACLGKTQRERYGELAKIAWYLKNSKKQTQPVGKKEGNEYGLYDMLGNIWEWCNDWYSSTYPAEPQTDPIGPVEGCDRILRGGSWSNWADRIRATHRYCQGPYMRNNNKGFRVTLPSAFQRENRMVFL